MVETILGEGVIKRCIKELQKSGLIEIIKKGLPAKNYFVLNKEAIESFDTKYVGEYENWSRKIYDSASEDRERFDNNQGLN